MKKLKFVDASTPVIGKVLEHTESLGFCMREYGANPFGNYDVLSTVPLHVDHTKILKRKNLIARVKRLHYYFQEAEYISEGAIDMLNINKEPIETLSQTIIF